MALGNTAKRILVSVISIPLILAVSFYGNAYFLLFVLFVALFSFYEFARMVKNKGANVNLILGFAAVFFFVLNGFRYFLDTYFFLLIFIAALSLTELFRNKNSAVYNIGTTFLGVFYIGLLASALIGIRQMYSSAGGDYYKGGYIIIAMFIAIWICDSAAFFGGTSLGKHKLFPRVSPNKSWEGAIFGFIFALVTMMFTKVIFLEFLSWQTIIALGIIIGIIGQLGDLIESLLKRDTGVKDSSNIIPGHGGIFDRFDSVLFTAPFVLMYLKYFGN